MTGKPEIAAHHGWPAVPPGSTSWPPSPRSRTSSSADLSSEPNHKRRNYPMSPSRFLLAQLAVDPAL